MDPAAFRGLLNDICTLNDSEGPSRNVLEPKFQARTQFEALESAIVATGANTAAAHEQLSHISSILIQNHLDTDESVEATKRAVACFNHLVDALIASGVPTNKAATVDEVLLVVDPLTSPQHDFACIAACIRCWNAIGILLTSRETTQRIPDALRVLHHAERLYDSWNATAKASSSAEQRQELDELYTLTVFYLAQCYSSSTDATNSSKYCHKTMKLQLVSKKDFSKQEWGRNAVHLSTVFLSHGLFGQALYCLRAARHVMPTERADETTVGVVSWGFAKYHKFVVHSMEKYIRKGGAPVRLPALYMIDAICRHSKSNRRSNRILPNSCRSRD